MKARISFVCFASRFHKMPGMRTGVGLASGTTQRLDCAGIALAATIAPIFVRDTNSSIGAIVYISAARMPSAESSSTDTFGFG